MRRHVASLRWRFALVGLAALAPLAVICLHFANSQREQALAAASQRVQALASVALSARGPLLNEVKSVAKYLAGEPELDALGPNCDAHLQRARALHSWITTLRAADRNGDIVCADNPDSKSLNVSDRSYFKTALSKGDFVVSDVVMSKLNATPSIHAAVPIERNGVRIGVFTIGIDLSAFGNLRMLQSLPEDIAILVVDRNGAVVASQPEMPAIADSDISGHPVVKAALQGTSATAELTDLTGTLRLFAFKKFEDGGIAIAVGLDKAAILRRIDAALHQQLFAIALIVGGAVLVAILGFDVLLGRPLRGLGRAAHRLERGDLTARSGLSGDNEVGRLGRAFDSMAQALQDRDLRLSAAEAALRAKTERPRGHRRQHGPGASCGSTKRRNAGVQPPRHRAPRPTRKGYAVCRSRERRDRPPSRPR